ncbi:hypothetical protein ACFC09_38090 [Streptomyces sp. NPDC056161]|uniref:hypothetical protein n=1 Tax=Streptomyces sp. NPDC056161 TaxID=3345732 RepID=UPI0035D6ECCF
MTTTEQNQIVEACRAHLSMQAHQDSKAVEVLVLKRHGSSGLTVQQLPVPDRLWEEYPPDTVITALADAAVLLGGAVTANAVAIALSYEGLAITSGASPQADEVIRRYWASGSIPSPADVPGRVHQRFASVVDRHGRHYLVPVEKRSADTAALGLSIGDADVMSGPAVEALATFAGAVWPHLMPDLGTPDTHHENF